MNTQRPLALVYARLHERLDKAAIALQPLIGQPLQGIDCNLRIEAGCNKLLLQFGAPVLAARKQIHCFLAGFAAVVRHGSSDPVGARLGA